LTLLKLIFADDVYFSYTMYNLFLQRVRKDCTCMDSTNDNHQMQHLLIQHV